MTRLHHRVPTATRMGLALAFVLGGCAASGTPASTGSPSPSPEATPTMEASHSAGDTRVDAAGITQVWVPAGTFRMGTTQAQADAILAANLPAWVAAEIPSEQPDHEVTLSQGYWIDRDEVTNDAYAAFVDAGGYTNRDLWSDDGWAWLQAQTLTLPWQCGGAPDTPRNCVTWYEAQAYAAWRGGRLPTEAEWEFAARGPDAHVYPWGDTWDPALANVVGATATVAVGSFPDGASWVGARDMAGNVMEWVADWLATDYYASSPATDPTGPATGAVKVEKGGWWGSNEWVARSAYRHFEDPPTYQDHHIGFRIVSTG